MKNNNVEHSFYYLCMNYYYYLCLYTGTQVFKELADEQIVVQDIDMNKIYIYMTCLLNGDVLPLLTPKEVNITPTYLTMSGFLSSKIYHLYIST